MGHYTCSPGSLVEHMVDRRPWMNATPPPPLLPPPIFQAERAAGASGAQPPGGGGRRPPKERSEVPGRAAAENSQRRG